MFDTEVLPISYNSSYKYNIDSYNCNQCSFKLTRSIIKERRLIQECYSCKSYDRYTDRPFALGASRDNFGECDCVYKTIDVLEIKCEECLKEKWVKCLICKKFLEKKIGKVEDKNCYKCQSEIEKEIFNNKTAQEKLKYYGIVKLKQLAKKKEIKNYSKYNKNELLVELSKIVNNNDFPIS
jgi:hypothetical protein